MKKAALIILSTIPLLCALFFPAAKIERQKAQRIATLDAAVEIESKKFTKEDDAYVDYVNHPYPISGSNIFRTLLFLDFILLLMVRKLWNFLDPKVSSDLKQPPYKKVEWVIVISLTFIGAVVRFVGANRDFWIDELATVFRYVHGSLSDILFQAVSSNNHLLNSFLAHSTAHLFGESELIIRLPAILFGIITIPVFYHFVRSLSSPKEALFASLLLTFSYHHIFFSQNARGYTSMLLGAILSTHFLILGFKRNRISDWIYYAISIVLSVVSVLFGVFIFASQIVCSFVYWLQQRTTIPESRTIFRRVFFAFGLAAYLILHIYAFIIPDVLGFIFGEYRQGEVGWKLSQDLAKVIHRGLALGPWTTIVILICGSFAIAGFISYLRRESFVAFLLISPALLTFLVVLLLHVGIFPRYFVFALPVAFLFLSRGLLIFLDAIFSNRTTKNFSYAVILALVVLGSAWMLRPFYQYPMQDFTGAKKFVLEKAKTSDKIVAIGIAAEGYRYYWPSIELTHRLTNLREITQQNNTVWLLYSFPGDMRRRRPKLQTYVEENFTLLKRFPSTVGDADFYVTIKK